MSNYLSASGDANRELIARLRAVGNASSSNELRRGTLLHASSYISVQPVEVEKAEIKAPTPDDDDNPVFEDLVWDEDPRLEPGKVPFSLNWAKLQNAYAPSTAERELLSKDKDPAGAMPLNDPVTQPLPQSKERKDTDAAHGVAEAFKAAVAAKIDEMKKMEAMQQRKSELLGLFEPANVGRVNQTHQEVQPVTSHVGAERVTSTSSVKPQNSSPAYVVHASTSSGQLDDQFHPPTVSAPSASCVDAPAWPQQNNIWFCAPPSFGHTTAVNQAEPMISPTTSTFPTQSPYYQPASTLHTSPPFSQGNGVFRTPTAFEQSNNTFPFEPTNSPLHASSSFQHVNGGYYVSPTFGQANEMSYRQPTLSQAHGAYRSQPAVARANHPTYTPPTANRANNMYRGQASGYQATGVAYPQTTVNQANNMYHGQSSGYQAHGVSYPPSTFNQTHGANHGQPAVSQANFGAYHPASANQAYGMYYAQQSFEQANGTYHVQTAAQAPLRLVVRQAQGGAPDPQTLAQFHPSQQSYARDTLAAVFSKRAGTDGAFLPSRLIANSTPQLLINGNPYSYHDPAAQGVMYNSNYHGQRTRGTNLDPDIEEYENTALWCTNIPVEASMNDILGAIRNCGRIYQCHINGASGGHLTQAAKIVFSRVSGKVAFQAAANTYPGVFILGRRIMVRPNRNRYRENLNPYQTRVLRIYGPVRFVNAYFLLDYFSTLFRSDVLQLDIGAMDKYACRTMVWTFGSLLAQAASAKLAIENEPALHDSITISYGPDPCE